MGILLLDGLAFACGGAAGGDPGRDGREQRVTFTNEFGLCDQLNGGIDTLTSRISRRPRLHDLGLKVDGLRSTGAGAGANGETTVHEHGGEDNAPPTPRVDKGKGRADPEPERPEKVLSPTFMITESEDECEDDHRYLDVEEVDEVAVQATSPTDRYVRFASGRSAWMDILTCL